MVEWSFLLLAAILFFIVFKDPLPIENNVQTLTVCSLIGVVISFVMFFALYHIGLYFFRNILTLLLFSLSIILFIVATVFYIYFKSGIFI